MNHKNILKSGNTKNNSIETKDLLPTSQTGIQYLVQWSEINWNSQTHISVDTLKEFLGNKCYFVILFQNKPLLMHVWIERIRTHVRRQPSKMFDEKYKQKPLNFLGIQ